MLWPYKKVYFADYTFKVQENVYEPAEDSFLFAENLCAKEGEVVLDVGTGCGILAIVAASRAARVIAIDINPYAVLCAKENARLNKVAVRMSFVCCDLLAAIDPKEKFDSILFNAPYLPSLPSETMSWLERAWQGGPTGRQAIDRFICTAPKHLGENGHIFLMQSVLSNVEETLWRFRENGMKADIVAELALPLFDEIVLIEAEKQSRCPAKHI